MPGLYKRGNIWWMWFHEDGKVRYKSTKCRKKSDAQKVLDARQASSMVAHYLPGVITSDATYEDIRRLLIRNYEQNDRKSNITLKLTHLDEFFKDSPVANITKEKIEDYIDMRKQAKNKKTNTPIRNATINRELAALRRMLKLGKESNLIYVIPDVPKNLAEQNTRTGYIDHADYKQLYKFLPTYLRPILVLAYKSGFRKGEILNLKWENVDIRKGMILIPDSKTGQPRIYPMDAELQREFRVLFQRKKKDIPYVFLNRMRTGRVRDFSYAWKKARKQAADYLVRPQLEKLLFHDLRRSAIRNMVRAGAPRKYAMMLSGHKSESVFERYNIVSEKDLQKTAEKTAEFLQKEHQEKWLDTLWDTEKS